MQDSSFQFFSPLRDHHVKKKKKKSKRHEEEILIDDSKTVNQSYGSESELFSPESSHKKKKKKSNIHEDDCVFEDSGTQSQIHSDESHFVFSDSSPKKKKKKKQKDTELATESREKGVKREVSASHSSDSAVSIDHSDRVAASSPQRTHLTQVSVVPSSNISSDPELDSEILNLAARIKSGETEGSKFTTPSKKRPCMPDFGETSSPMKKRCIMRKEVSKELPATKRKPVHSLSGDESDVSQVSQSILKSLPDRGKTREKSPDLFSVRSEDMNVEESLPLSGIKPLYSTPSFVPRTTNTQSSSFKPSPQKNFKRNGLGSPLKTIQSISSSSQQSHRPSTLSRDLENDSDSSQENLEENNCPSPVKAGLSPGRSSQQLSQANIISTDSESDSDSSHSDHHGNKFNSPVKTAPPVNKVSHQRQQTSTVGNDSDNNNSDIECAAGTQHDTAGSVGRRDHAKSQSAHCSVGSPAGRSYQTAGRSDNPKKSKAWRYESPAGSREVEFDATPVAVEDIESDTEIWIIKLPTECGLSSLHGKKFNPNKVTEIKDKGTKYQLRSSRLDAVTQKTSLLLPSKTDGKLHYVGPAVGQMWLTEKLSVPTPCLPTPQPKRNSSLPPGIKFRNVPFGSGVSLNPRSITEMDISPPVPRSKHKKKKKRIHREAAEQSSENIANITDMSHTNTELVPNLSDGTLVRTEMPKKMVDQDEVDSSMQADTMDDSMLITSDREKKKKKKKKKHKRDEEQ